MFFFQGDQLNPRRKKRLSYRLPPYSTARFFFQAEDGIRDVERSRGLGDVYKRQHFRCYSASPPRSLTTKMDMSPSFTVHGGQHDARYVTFELLMHAAFVADVKVHRRKYLVRYYNEARSRERSDRGRFLPIGKKASSLRGAYRVPLFSLSVCVRVCLPFIVFADCESCTWPISTNSGSMEANECGRTRGTCFIKCRLEVVAVVGLLWLKLCVFCGADFFVVYFPSFSFLRTHTACFKYEAASFLIYLSSSSTWQAFF